MVEEGRGGGFRIPDRFIVPEKSPIDFLEGLLLSTDRAEQFLAGFFADAVDLSDSEAVFLEDIQTGDVVLSAPMEKDCRPRVFLALKSNGGRRGENLILAIDHKPVLPGRQAQFELCIEGTDSGEHGMRFMRYPHMRFPEIVHGSEWSAAALRVATAAFCLATDEFGSQKVQSSTNSS